MSEPKQTTPLERTMGVLGAVTAARALVSGSRGLGWTVEGGRGAVRMGRLALGRRAAAAVPADLSTDATERFEEMRRMHAVKEREVEPRRRAARTMFLSYLAASLAMVTWAAVSPRLGLASGLAVVVPWAIAALLGLKAMHWSLLHHHLLHRRLTPFREWLRNPANPMEPVFQSGGAARAAGRTLAILLGLSLLHPALALAQGTGAVAGAQSVMATLAGNLDPGDLSLAWMQRLFPSVFPATGLSIAQDATAQMLSTLNSILLVASCAMIGWETLMGMVHAAHTGKAMSDRYHAMWVPIRMVVGIGSVFPVQGYCLAQLVIISIALGGYKVANTVWSGYVQVATSMRLAAGPGLSGEGRWAMMPGGGGLTVPPESVAQLPTLQAVLNSEACYQAFLYDSRAPGQSAPPAQPAANSRPGMAGTRPLSAQPPAGGTDIDGGNGRTWDWGTACGSVTWNVRPVSQGTTVTTSDAMTGYTTVITIPPEARVAEREGYMRDFDTKRAAAFGVLVQAVRDSSLVSGAAALAAPNASVGASPPNLVNAMNTTLAAYGTFRSTLVTLSSDLSARLNTAGYASMLERASKLGWASAGAQQPAIVRANAVVVGRLTELPTVQAANPGSPSLSTDGRKTFAGIAGQLSELANGVLPTATAGGQVGGTSVPEMDVLRELRNNPDTALNNFVGRVTRGIFSAVERMVRLDPVDPLSSIQNEGQAMEAGLLGGWAGWNLVLGAIGSAKGVADGASASVLGWAGLGVVTKGVAEGIYAVAMGISGFMSSFFFWALALAALYSTVLPMLGYIYWMFGVAGIIVYTAEGVVGSAFWAFAHVRTDNSQDFVGPAQSYGYGVAFNFFFRPTLMIIGLALGHVVFAVMAGFVNATFALAAGSAFTGESFYGSRMMSPMGVLVLIGMLFYIHYQIGVRAYGLITQLPDRVSRWMGASFSGIGEEGHAEGVHSAVVGGVMTQTRAMGGMSVVNRNRQNGNDNANTRNKDRQTEDSADNEPEGGGSIRSQSGRAREAGNEQPERRGSSPRQGGRCERADAHPSRLAETP